MDIGQRVWKLITDRFTTASGVMLGNTKLQLPKPGQLLTGTNLIFITVLEPVNRKGKVLGRKLAYFGATENLPGDARNFKGNAAAIADLKNWHNHDGWKHDPQSSGTSSYEEALFNGLHEGSAIGKWTMPELALVGGFDRHRIPVSVNANMLAFSKDPTSPFYNSFVTIPNYLSKTWSQSCTEDPDIGGSVRKVHFPDGGGGWEYQDVAYHRSSVRAVVALELVRLDI